MIVLVDSDILLDVGYKRMPWARTGRQLFTLLQSGRITGFVSWHSVANVHYIARRMGALDATDFLRDLLTFLRVAPVTHADMLFALDQDMSDFEDAMQVAAAIACRASRIVTRNTRHYRGSVIPAVTPAQLLKVIGKA
jgi:predicted nucleic acid-binding protein